MFLDAEYIECSARLHTVGARRLTMRGVHLVQISGFWRAPLALGAMVLFSAPISVKPVHVDVLTRHNNVGHTGANLEERLLNTSNVRNGSFGKVAYRLIDGNPYAQPLVVSEAKAMGRSTTNLVLVATEHNSVYAFDADDVNASSNRSMVWHTGPDVLGDPIDSYKLYSDIGIPQCTDITTEFGITSTPVIKLTRAKAPKQGVIFVMAKTMVADEYTYSLFALDLASGTKVSKTEIQGQVAGTGTGSSVVNGKSILKFNARYQLNRPALLLDGNTLYVAFGSHCDTGPYHGWVFAYDVSNPAALKQLAVYCTTPNSTGGPLESRAGIWMSGEAPALDSDGAIYFSTGDGSYDARTEFGNSIVKLKLTPAGFQVQDWFTPENQEYLKDNDVDLGSGGVTLIPNSHLLLQGGKEGRLFLIDRNHMGRGVGPAVQSLQATHPHDGIRFYNIHGSPPLWLLGDQMFVYINGEENPFNQYRLVRDNTPGGAGWKLDPPDRPYRTTGNCPEKPNCLMSPYPNYPNGLFGMPDRTGVWMPGASMALSANGSDPGSGILWAAMPYAENANHQVVRGVLRALDASDVSKGELWDSESTGDPNDRLGQFAKFCPPTVANGKVYVATFQQEIILENGTHVIAPPPGDRPALVIYGLKNAR